MSKRISIIEIDLPKCGNDYGIAPCTASGSSKCFNCLNTCQDVNNYNEITETARYSKPSSNFPEGFPSHVGNVSSISYSPPVLKLGESLGTRASISVQFADHPSPDTDASGDKYISERPYNPFEAGTYFGKFKARYPFLQGRELRWIQGTPDQSIDNMETRTFVIEAMTGPSSSGAFSITAKDILKLADNDRTLCPPARNIETITTAIDETYTGFLGIGTGNANIIPSPGYAVMSGSEIVSYEKLGADPTGTTIEILTRGEFGTEAIAHDVGSTFQDAKTWTGQKASAILYDLLVNYAGVDPSYISLADWTIEDDAYLQRLYGTTLAVPTGVAKLINELLTQTASTIWWDNEANLLRWQVLRNQSTGNTVFSQEKYMRGSFNVIDDNSQRVSRCFVRYGQKNPLINLDEPSNFGSTVLRLEIESERFFENKEAYRTINSRWIPASAKDTAERLGDLILQRYSFPPRKVGFRLLRDSGVEIPQLAGSYNLQAQTLQNADGTSATMPIQVTSLSPSDSVITVSAEEITYNEIITPADPNVINLTVGSSQTGLYDIRAEYDQQKPAPDANTVVNVYVPSGVIVGSSSVNQFAMTTGLWPSGATINLYINGYIVGKGGNGGDGASCKWSDTGGAVITQNATQGQDGGPALEVLHPISIDNQGVIGGGGGGGGGCGAATIGAVALAACGTGGPGGSGGAGSISGSGGAVGIRELSASGSTDITPIDTPPTAGAAGGLATGGGIADTSQSYNIKSVFQYTFTCIARSSEDTELQRGAGGDLGQDGEDGAPAVASYNYDGPPVSVDEAISLPASGGIAGTAVETNSIITWINLGDVRGIIADESGS